MTSKATCDVKKVPEWTMGLSVEDLRKKLEETLASERHWELRKDGNTEEIHKGDWESCSFCQVKVKSSFLMIIIR